MSRFVRRKPSPSMVISLLALVIATAGTGYAAITLPKNSVGPQQIRTNAVKSSDIARGAVRTGDVKDGNLRAGDFAPGQLPAGATGLTGPAGPPGAPGETGPAGPPGPATGAAGGDLTGSYPDPELRGASVGPDELGAAPAVKVGRSSATTIPPSAGASGLISWNTEYFDVGDMHSPGGSALTAPRAGLYEVTANIVLRRDAGAAGIYREVLISQDGTVLTEENHAPQPTAVYREGYSVSALTSVAAGATWVVRVAHDAANALALESNTYTNFSARWVGPRP